MSVASPRTLVEALDLLAHATPDTRLLAGGTDLMVEFGTGRTGSDSVVNLWGLDELRGIVREDGGLRLGALTTCADMVQSTAVQELDPILAAAADEVGAMQIKNRATLGGNLGTASPAADLNPVLCALGASVRLVSSAGRRDVLADEFLTGYRSTVRRPDELIESVFLPAAAPGRRAGFRKVGTRRAQSISKVVVAVVLVLEPDRVASVRGFAGSVAERTLRLASLERLVGTRPTDADLLAVARAAAVEDARPMDDVRSTATFRRHVLRRVLTSLLAELLGDWPRA